jgi:RNA polymerase sigma factor (sigma-70 family)
MPNYEIAENSIPTGTIYFEPELHQSILEEQTLHESDITIEPNERDDFDILEDFDAASIGIFGMRMKEVYQFPRLSLEEETRLFQTRDKGRLAQQKLDTANGTLQDDERQELENTISEGKVARDWLICANRRLVTKVAGQYGSTRGTLSFLDLLQEGDYGLIDAVDNEFDSTRGSRLSACAYICIRRSISDAQRLHSRTISLSILTVGQLIKVEKARSILLQKHKRPATIEEISSETHIQIPRLKEILSAEPRSLSLDLPVDGVDADDTLGDHIQDNTKISVEEQVTRNIMREQLLSLISTLPPRDQLILKMRYGFLDGQIYTLDEIAEKVGLKSKRVWQVEKELCARLRATKGSETLREYIL